MGLSQEQQPIVLKQWKFQNAQFELKYGTKANLGTQNPNMDEIFENLKKWAGHAPKMRHLPLKWAKI